MRQKLTNSDVFKIMEQWAPRSHAYDWDNVGLQIGSHNQPVKKIMVTLDVMESVVDEAIDQQVNLIIAHHPMLFKPIRQLNTDSSIGRTIKKLLENDITVYASHTNLDVAVGGVNDMLSDQLNLGSRKVLVPTYREPLYKIAIYVPHSHKSKVLDALGENGAGHIGNYSHCTFQTEGKGSFKPLDGSQPFIGTTNEIEKVDEVKIETIVQESNLKKVVQAMTNSHPYEEPAYDIFPLENEGEQYGIGRIGELEHAMNVEAFCNQLKLTLGLKSLRVTGDLSKNVKKVAVLGGSGEKYIHAAKRKGADIFITGDMTFHVAQEAWQLGLVVIDAGHYIEKVMKNGTKNYLDKSLTNTGIDIITSHINSDPFQFV
ncbi:Nif3-like dinuclear metal center hexameric protein [Ornithinibacillus salinisoli]|uniref:GTP cyclohydrolase 1 type 2 homolog n=1 Tax=Ornithinibacillus salinisoli TaxID=1848459 RepID=A0ABW4W4E5_9BACI